MRVRIRGQTSGIEKTVREHADRMIRLTMGRFATAVEDVSLLLEEFRKRSGSGGAVFRCRVSVRLTPRGHVSVKHTAGEASAAIDGALERASRTVERRLQLRLQGDAPYDRTARCR